MKKFYPIWMILEMNSLLQIRINTLLKHLKCLLHSKNSLFYLIIRRSAVILKKNKHFKNKKQQLKNRLSVNNNKFCFQLFLFSLSKLMFLNLEHL